MIWKESPLGLSYHVDLDAELATYLQEVANLTVLYSDSDWNINIDSPQADFQINNINNCTNKFENNSIGASGLNYHWDFGDGNTLTYLFLLSSIKYENKYFISPQLTEYCFHKYH